MRLVLTMPTSRPRAVVWTSASQESAQLSAVEQTSVPTLSIVERATTRARVLILGKLPLQSISFGVCRFAGLRRAPIANDV